MNILAALKNLFVRLGEPVLEHEIETDGEKAVENLLDKLHGKNAELHKATVISGKAFTEALIPAAAETTTGLDDSGLEAFHTACVNSGTKFGVFEAAQTNG